MFIAVFESVGDHAPYHFGVLSGFILGQRVTELIEKGRLFRDREGGSIGFLGEIDERIVVGTVDPIRASGFGQEDLTAYIQKEVLQVNPMAQVITLLHLCSMSTGPLFFLGWTYTPT